MSNVTVPPGGEGYRAEFIRLYGQRVTMVADMLVENAKLGARGAPFSARKLACAYRGLSPDCLITDAYDAQFVVWLQDMTGLRSRYDTWRLSQGH